MPFRPRRVRTYVRVQGTPLFRGRGAQGNRRIDLVLRGLAPTRNVRERRIPPDSQEVRAALGHLDEALGSLRSRPRARAASTPPNRRDPGRAFAVRAPPSQGARVRRRPEAADLRALRPRRSLARQGHGIDPGSRQRRVRRQPTQQPANRLSELRRDSRHVRTEATTDPRRPGVPALWKVLPAARRPPALLLTRMRNAMG